MTSTFKDARVAVLMGGLSSEREVSLETGAGALAALSRSGYDAFAIDWKAGDNLPAILTETRTDVVWNALHGTFGEDGAVQGLLACMNIPCTGSGILASAVAMDKILSKRIFRQEGIPTPDWLVLADDAPGDVSHDFAFPVVVKPANEGSSVGVTIARDQAEQRAGIEKAQRHRGQVIIEPYIPGAEVCVGILGDRALGSLAIKPSVEFYDYDAKYQRDDTEYTKLPGDPAAIAHIEAISLAAHKTLGCTGYSRVDLRVTDAGSPFVLEVNTLPGMTSHSLLPKIAANAGMTYDQLCEQILAEAGQRA